MKRTQIYVLAGVLSAIGAIVFAYKVWVLDFPLVPDERRTIWQVEARLSFTALNRPVKAQIFVPQTSPGFTLLDQSFVAPDFGVTSTHAGPNTVATFSISQASGKQVIYVRALIDKSDVPDAPPRPPPAEATPRKLDEASATAADGLIKEIRTRAADNATFVALLVQRLRATQHDGPTNILLGRQPSEARIVRTTVDVLNRAGIPALGVSGIDLSRDSRNARLVHWLEIHDGKAWRAHDPKTGQPGVPRTWLPWWRGRTAIATATGGATPTTTIAINRKFEVALSAALRRGERLDQSLVRFSLFGLPLATQEVYRLLLVIPVGVLFLAFLRNVIGVKTFGTFMPVLIAVAFRQTELVLGIVLFSLVLGVGLLVRSYMETLKLLLVPRLAAVVIVVILMMAIISVFSYRIGFESGLSVALFPIVILAMTIERASIVWEERGAREAWQQIAGSLAVAALCYLIMKIGQVEYMAFVFPELLLIILALTVLLGRYAGFRLTEVWRFKVLAKDT